jgi:hypothetical protein
MYTLFYILTSVLPVGRGVRPDERHGRRQRHLTGRQLAERGRIERAAVLIGLGAVDRFDVTTYHIASQTASGETYTVTPGGCICLDAQRQPGQRCKHQWAVRITLSAQMAEPQDREQVERAAVTADQVALAYGRSIGWAA